MAVDDNQFGRYGAENEFGDVIVRSAWRNSGFDVLKRLIIRQLAECGRQRGDGFPWCIESWRTKPGLVRQQVQVLIGAVLEDRPVGIDHPFESAGNFAVEHCVTDDYDDDGWLCPYINRRRLKVEAGWWRLAEDSVRNVREKQIERHIHGFPGNQVPDRALRGVTQGITEVEFFDARVPDVHEAFFEVQCRATFDHDRPDAGLLAVGMFDLQHHPGLETLVVRPVADLRGVQRDLVAL